VNGILHEDCATLRWFGICRFVWCATQEAMKAIVQDRYGEAEVLRLEDVPMPTIGDGDVLVRVRAAGLERGVWHLMAGRPYAVRLAFGLSSPKVRIRGVDFAGTVEAVGKLVTRFQVGDEVFGAARGAFAEFVVAKESQIVTRPEAVSVEEAAALAVSGCTALQALRRSGVKAGQKVLVIGASGGSGAMAVQLAVAMGMVVTGVCSGSKAEFVRGLGAERVIDYRHEGCETWGRGYDAILDLAGSRPLSVLRRMLKEDGTIVIIGAENGGDWIGSFTRGLTGLAMGPFWRQKVVSLLAVVGGEDLSEVAKRVCGENWRRVVGHRYALADAVKAVQDMQDGLLTGKAVIVVRG